MRSVREVRERIAGACARAGRRPDGVRLVAASKTVPVERIRQAWEAGVHDFAENYARELAEKSAHLPQATWHFIGRLQAGTAATVADNAEWVHSAEPGRGLSRAAGRAARAGRVLRSLVQVDFTGRRQGIAPEEIEAFLEEAAGMEGIEVVGLMTLPPFAPDPETSRPYFRRLRDLLERSRIRWPKLQELSMGMSLDYEVAVEEGATMVRVGTALFGTRPATGTTERR